MRTIRLLLVVIVFSMSTFAQIAVPRLISKTEPEYSRELRNAGVEGTVVIGCEIDENGIPQNCEVQQSPDSRLNQKALEAVSQWRFQPGTNNGHPVTVKANLEIRFRLLPKTQSTSSRSAITAPESAEHRIASAQSLSLVGCTGVCAVNKSPDPGALDSTGGQFAQVQQSVDRKSVM